MPPVRLNLPELPRAADGAGGEVGGGGVERSAAGAVPGLIVGGDGYPLGAWPTWPLIAMKVVHSTVKGWATKLDAALLALPRGVGPAVSSLVRPARGGVGFIVWIVGFVLCVYDTCIT